MALCNLTKVAKLCLVYFSVDKSTCIIETKKLRLKETGKLFSETAPNARDVITVKSGGKLLDAMVIATGDNEDNINKEERAFVETNPGLFNPEPVSPGKKRTNKDKDASTSKKRKASSDEVSL
ncbi:unnamed protein product [Porites lobata]|uniref:Uncharacterized protein n=1 Tax=Porites lobata TaxID=104759 RepID=A0ABN8NPP4_9CNID|nr:unnamed protein product [Porites lobata]